MNRDRTANWAKAGAVDLVTDPHPRSLCRGSGQHLDDSPLLDDHADAALDLLRQVHGNLGLAVPGRRGLHGKPPVPSEDVDLSAVERGVQTEGPGTRGGGPRPDAIGANSHECFSAVGDYAADFPHRYLLYCTGTLGPRHRGPRVPVHLQLPLTFGPDICSEDASANEPFDGFRLGLKQRRGAIGQRHRALECPGGSDQQ